MKHYLSFIQDTMCHYWHKPAVTDYGDSVSYTYGQLAEKAAWLGVAFKHLGLKKGTKMAICGRNSSNWGAAYLSIAAYDAVAVSILPDFTSDNIHDLVNHSDARVLFVGPWVRGRLDMAKMPQIEAFISIEDFSIISSTTPVSIEEIDADFQSVYGSDNGLNPEQMAERHKRLTDYPVDNLDNLALINYTSGSTGSPKGVMLTHRNLSSNVMFGQKGIPNGPDCNYVSFLPLAHMFGLMFEFLYQMAGGTHVYFITRSITPTLLLRAFADVQPYMILTVPLIIEKIFKKQVFPAISTPLVHTLWYIPGIGTLIRRKVYRQLMKAFGGHLRYLIIGGAALNEDVERCLRQIHFPYTCGYGMTECGPLLCYESWRKFVFRSCGKVIDRTQIRIDSENPHKVEGEILVKGSGVMRGYYKNLQATDNTFTNDGWMRTGDIGIIDRKGNVFLRGRSKNMILGASGQNIYPEEIEDKLNAMEGVAESVVVEREGKLVGLVFPDSILELDTEKMRKLMQDNLQKLNRLLPNFSKVNNIELVDKEFEKTPKKSIKRFLYK